MKKKGCVAVFWLGLFRESESCSGKNETECKDQVLRGTNNFYLRSTLHERLSQKPLHGQAQRNLITWNSRLFAQNCFNFSSFPNQFPQITSPIFLISPASPENFLNKIY